MSEPPDECGQLQQEAAGAAVRLIGTYILKIKCSTTEAFYYDLTLTPWLITPQTIPQSHQEVLFNQMCVRRGYTMKRTIGIFKGCWMCLQATFQIHALLWAIPAVYLCKLGTAATSFQFTKRLAFSKNTFMNLSF